jgi:hypothetical protein
MWTFIPAPGAVAVSEYRRGQAMIVERKLFECGRGPCQL